MCIAAAIIGGAVIGVGGSLIAGHQAAGATQAAANTASGDVHAALNQQAQLAAPYTQLGQAAIPQLQALTDPTKSAATLSQMPGFQFAQQQGTTATENAASAMGLGLSGNTLEGLSQFNQGLANQTFQQEYQDVLSQVQLGQGAAAGQAANIGQAGTNLANIAIGQGQNLAGIGANTIAGITKAIGGAGNQFITANTLAGLGGGGATSPGTPSPDIPYDPNLFPG